jgi:hypothetical protein
MKNDYKTLQKSTFIFIVQAFHPPVPDPTRWDLTPIPLNGI